MKWAESELKKIYEGMTEVDAVPLDRIDVADPRLYQEDRWRPSPRGCGGRRRSTTAPRARTAPTGRSRKLKDIMTVEVNHEIYSSAAELGGIQVEDQPKDMDRPSFIRMDPPRHTHQRRWWR